MGSDAWRLLLVVALGLNAVAGFVYRLYRFRKGGPVGDVWGQALLGVLLAGLALSIGLGGDWARWPALAYAVLFGVVVMPIWTLAVLIPLPPARVDYAFTALYWTTLLVIGVAAILL
ncbi:MAG TPA: hypothetical protein VJ927_05335 [Actinomycetota bacterium]|nr:hypothetical protein [Actinomycetota bacterium]